LHVGSSKLSISSLAGGTFSLDRSHCGAAPSTSGGPNGLGIGKTLAMSISLIRAANSTKFSNKALASLNAVRASTANAST
jgi:hypothetical protein